MVEKKYVDVNVFAYWLGAHPEFGTRAREWVESINEAKHGEYITSTLTLYELAVIMAMLLIAWKMWTNYESEGKDIVVRVRDHDFIAYLIILDANGKTITKGNQPQPILAVRRPAKASTERSGSAAGSIRPHPTFATSATTCRTWRLLVLR